MPESEYRAYLKRQGQETPPEIEQFLPDEPPVLTEEEKLHLAELRKLVNAPPEVIRQVKEAIDALVKEYPEGLAPEELDLLIGTPVLTEEERMFCATGDEREAWARERSQALSDSLPLQPGKGYAALAEAKAVLDEYRRRRSEGI